ncbi:hypothetical protein A3D85_01735 [Candidatus Amesbacteria bacterium RIFCSPHIGHO2_02_FULL_47_9]|nr:MAG: hypothetical protein A3D85_01735 [Candidatus Amesbacteria bacterium RIFCSPHIGHO2_02_FULL_47_9]
MTYFVDTNVFLRAILQDDKSKGDECVSFLEKIKLNRIDAVTSHLVLAEMVWTLARSYRATKKEIVRAAKSVVNLRGLKLEDSYDLNLALPWFETKGVKFVDCLLASCEKLASKVWVIVSYDGEFDKLGVVRKEPGEVK